MREQLILIFGQAEKPSLLLRPFNGRALGGQLDAPFPVDQLFLIIKGFIADGIPALITVKIEIA